MSGEFAVRDNDRQQIRQLRTFKGDDIPVAVDFGPWSEDNGAVTTATWTVLSGTATVDGQALASSENYDREPGCIAR